MNKEDILNELKKDLVHNTYRDTYVIRGENLPFLAEKLVKLFCQPAVSGNEVAVCDHTKFQYEPEDDYQRKCSGCGEIY